MKKKIVFDTYPDKEFTKGLEKHFRKAAKETMRVMGYNVIAKDGWIVKIYPDGKTKKIKKI